MKTHLTACPKILKRESTSPICRRVSVLESAFCLLPVLCLLGARVAAQTPSDKAAGMSEVVRACASAPTSSKPARKDKAKGKGGAANSMDIVPACLEAKASPIQIQEFLQAYVRDEKWTILGEKTAEDLWTFSRSLDKDELVRFSKEEPFAGRVIWSDGKAFVQVRTVELQGGFTRVQIFARIQGSGENADRFAPPQDSWQLQSNGMLENTMIAALETHFKSLHQ